RATGQDAECPPTGVKWPPRRSDRPDDPGWAEPSGVSSARIRHVDGHRSGREVGRGLYLDDQPRIDQPLDTDHGACREGSAEHLATTAAAAEAAACSPTKETV